jgi:hypothetical protein
LPPRLTSSGSERNGKWTAFCPFAFSGRSSR